MKEAVAAFDRSLSRRSMLKGTALAGLGVAGGTTLLSACGGGSSPAGSSSGAAGQVGGAVTWGSWANPGEAERFKSYSKDYAAKSGTKVTYQTVVGDYQAKLLTQLAGGTAPDAFYIGDTTMSKLIEANQLVELGTYLDSADSPVKFTDIYEGLSQWCKGPDGKVYGVPVDCNPKTFWYNKDMLAAAGVAQTPYQMFEAGTWNQAALTDLLTKVKATGKRGMVFEANWFDLCSWITTFGGTAFDEEGKAVMDTDPKALAALEWLVENMNNENISYGGALPKGQGVDALFYGQQLATIQYGRWILPNLKKLKFGYDIAPLPSESGKDVAPIAVYTAAMGVNAKAKEQDPALAFLGNFVSKEGERARLSGGGNAVPAIAGLQDVLTEGGLPEHGAIFEEIAKNGYAVPKVLYTDADKATNFPTKLDAFIKAGNLTGQSLATQAASLLNA